MNDGPRHKALTPEASTVNAEGTPVSSERDEQNGSRILSAG